MVPEHILLIDIDALRPDVFHRALEADRLPNIGRLLGGQALGRALAVPTVASAPSITFCSQASLFTGAHPNEHGILGNQFFDRFGTHHKGLPSYIAFDVGDTLEIDDGVRVFTSGLASRYLQRPTFYETMAAEGRRSVVAGNMYAKGADVWLKPSLIKLARFTKGGKHFGISSATYDRDVLDKLLKHISRHPLPDIMTMYFLGIDHDSHNYGPGAQFNYLVNHIDPMIGELWDAIRARSSSDRILVALFSDHGQIGVIKDQQHALRFGFRFKEQITSIFKELGLNAYRYPGQDRYCEAVMALNGGLGDVYLQNRRTGAWKDAPRFEHDLLPVAQAFWEAHQHGRYTTHLQGALAGILVRNVERDGWQARYQALTPSGALIPLADWFAMQPPELYLDPVYRLNNRAGRYASDIVIISNYADGYYFGSQSAGTHGGLHPQDSRATLVYGWPDASPAEWQAAKEAITNAIQARCQAEGGRLPCTADMLTGLQAVWEPAKERQSRKGEVRERIKARRSMVNGQWSMVNC